jgi:hypothetical protein
VIFTFVWAFELQSDKDFMAKLVTLFGARPRVLYWSCWRV